MDEKQNGLPELPGFDVSGAVQRLAGNANLYKTLLQRFYQGYANSGQDLADQIAAGSWEEAQRNAHTIKGLAGTLGHPELAAASAALEAACRSANEGNPPASLPPAELAPFQAQLAAVIGTLAGAFGW